MIFKEIYSIIPPEFLKRFRLNLLLSFLNQLLDFSSIILLAPVIVGLFNPDLLVQAMKLHFNLPAISGNFQLGLIFTVLVFFLLKNLISVRIIRFQSDFYYSLSNSLSTGLLRNFLNKDLLSVRAKKKSTTIKDLVFIPNNFVIYVLSAGIQLLADVFLLFLILLFCFIINPAASFCLLVIAVLMLICLYYFDRNKAISANEKVSQKYDANFNHLLNAVNGYTEIKINQLEDHFMEKFSASNLLLNKMYSVLNANRTSKPKYTETFLIVIIAVLFVFSRYLSHNNSNLVVLISFLFAATIKIIPSINSILIGLINIKANNHTIEILKPQKKKNTVPLAQNISFREAISLQDISFSYESKLILNHVTLEIPKGHIVGIFGGSGNGKSTLINIIATLITADSGILSCDQTAIFQEHRASFMNLLAYVPQSPFIFEETIAQNLSLGNQASQQTISHYLTLFELEKTIENLPQKENTFIGNNENLLSGGQLQRLAIIRALLRNPEILILDEATNQLDDTLRDKIAGILKEISKEKYLTIITVSHHKKELENFCDAVYELKNATLHRIE